MDLLGLQKRKHYYVHFPSSRLAYHTVVPSKRSVYLHFEGALELGMLVVNGTPAVNGGITVPISGRVI